jgi:hypothetical protein
MMSLGEWLNGFRDLHQRAKRDSLTAEERATYHAAREELAEVILTAQRISLPSGKKARQALRAARALQVDIEFGSRTLRGLTHQVSPGGFGALLSPWPLLGETVSVTLRLTGDELLRARARVVEAREQGGHARVSFEFVGLSDSDVERLEVFVFDAILEQFQAK